MVSVSWLDALSDHPIFQSSGGSADELDGLPSPDASSIAAASSFATDDDSENDADVTASLHNGSRADASLLRSTVAPLGGRRRVLAVVRGSELLAVVDGQLRIASLADFKTEHERHDDPAKSTYKVIRLPQVTFQIFAVVPNPTDKLIAVVGAHCLAVFTLPPRFWSTQRKRMIDVKAVNVGSFALSKHAARIAEVQWHPLGLGGHTLCVLTADGYLREYDVTEDAEEPQQTFNLGTPPARDRSERASSSVSIGLDDDEIVASSFTFGAGDADWGLLTLFCLMQSGDIFALCPYLPKRSTLSLAYVDRLQCFVEYKVKRFTAAARTDDDLLGSMSTSAAARTREQKRLGEQSRFVKALSKLAASAPHRQPPKPALVAAEQMGPASDDVLVDITASADLLRSLPVAQGPFLLQPAPRALSSSFESVASDISLVACSPSLRLLLVASSDGRIDVCLLVDAVEARWTSSRHDDPCAVAVYETIDLGLLGELDAQAPALDESLAKLSLISPSSRALEHNVPVIVSDALRPSRLYIRHALGTHALSFDSWLPALSAALAAPSDGADDAAHDLDRLLHRGATTDVRWLVKLSELNPASMRPRSPAIAALEVIDDVYLGYGLLMATADAQPIGIELRMAATAEPVEPDEDLKPVKIEDIDETVDGTVGSEYVSTLSARPFAIPKLLAGDLPSRPRVTTPARRKAATDATSVDDIATLRELGEAATSLRTGIRDLASAGNVVQDRIALQIGELRRQLERLDEIRSLATDATTPGALDSRLRSAAKTQAKLLERMDRVLQRLMNRHQRAISSYERQWFGELDRVEIELSPQNDALGKSFKSRTARMSQQLRTLRPSVEALQTKRQTASPAPPVKLGSSQLAAARQQLQTELEQLDRAIGQLDVLTGAIARFAALEVPAATS